MPLTCQVNGTTVAEASKERGPIRSATPNGFSPSRGKNVLIIWDNYFIRICALHSPRGATVIPCDKVKISQCLETNNIGT